ncbi:RHS repeat-associated core domain-containing protein [Paenibacillus sediminis]|uniref:RHS repeat-associated protein n=1 Tax=Paenibacillus sediminis TaxID=664909 RepID=A0ABS4H157_9BACL|nr:RHS repeat-associated core domain-containing protein [Paenibacillus sediminis]MBP1936007.1 RHS repeat-associated protein [Paenibacillus sediminis]
MHPGGPRDGWEKQYKKTHWELNYTNDVSLDLPEPLQVTEADETKWKESYVYGAKGEPLSMTYLPANDPNNGWEPAPGEGGAEPGTQPKTLWYMQDALGSVIGLVEKDGRVSSRYHYDEFGIPLDSKKFDLNWPGPDNLFGYTGLGYDYNSGLSYARARYYEPEIGRFVSEDTYEGQIDNPLTLNLYTYVGNNPLIRWDPSGNNWVTSGLKRVSQGLQNAWDATVDFADTAQKAAQRKVWRTAAEEGIRGVYGYNITADLLLHSLQDEPGTLVLGNDSYAASQIKQDQSFNKQLEKYVYSMDAFKNGNTLKTYFSSTFNSGDLEAAIHNYDMNVSGYRQSDGPGNYTSL